MADINPPSGVPSSASGDRRLHARVGEPILVLRFSGAVYAAKNWSLGGALIEGYGGGLGTGALLTVDGLGSDENDVQEARIRARVVRADPAAGRLSVGFLSLDDNAYGVLAELTRSVEANRR